MADVLLPYRSDWRSMATLLDYAKGKGIDRATLESRMGAGEGLRETVNAVEQLGLALRDDVGDVRLTARGERLAYASSEGERRDELAQAMLGYPPYAIPLERALAEEMTVLDGPWVERVWQVDMRLGQPRNRVEEARTFFFRLADEAGLGAYRRGVRGQPTRLDLAPDITARLADLRRTMLESASAAEPEPAAKIERAAAGLNLSSLPAAAGPAAAVTLNLTVDMTGWELEKIEALLRLLGIVKT